MSENDVPSWAVAERKTLRADLKEAEKLIAKQAATIERLMQELREEVRDAQGD